MKIVALGGGGFTAGPGDDALDAYVAALAGRRRRPRICLLPTAGGDAQEQIARFDATFRQLGCVTSHVSLFRLGDRPFAVADHLLTQDVIYVGGGSMLNLIAVWRAHGIDRILHRAWTRGIVLCGVSAGSMCWFEQGITTSTGAPAPAEGLGFLAGSNSVHRDSQPDRRPAYHAALRDGSMRGGWAVDDGVALVFEGTELTELISARPGAGAARTDLVDGRVVEVELAGRLVARPEGVWRVDPGLGELRELRAARLRVTRARARGAYG